MSTDTEATTDASTAGRVVPATVMMGNKPEVILAEATDAPGLVITPLYSDAEGFTGAYTVTHAASGYTLPIDRYGVDLHSARRVADELAKLDIDWTLDRDALIEQYRTRRPDINAAIKKGRWSYTGEDFTPDEPLPAGEYPRDAAEATAATMSAVVLRAALQRATDTWDLVGHDRDDKAGRDAFYRNTELLLADYGFVAAIRALAEIAPEAADAIARDIWQAFDDGSTIHEEVAEWGAEHGLPVPEKISPEAAAVVAERKARNAAADTAQAPADSPAYAHDADCNTAHEASPEPCPPPTDNA